MAFYLGIDGGGTKTRCVLGDETEVLATVAAGGSNVVRAGAAQARESLTVVVREACTTANVGPEQIRAVCIGAAGAARPEVETALREILARLTPASVQVVGDMVIALEAAFGSGPGVIAIAGTGSIAWGRDASGRTARAGGWGFAISDEGSGHWIGRRAVSEVVHARDRGAAPPLAELVLQAWNLTTFDQLIQAANALPPPEFPRLFPVVLQASEAGDSVARTVLELAGERLADLVVMVVRRLSPQPPHAPVAMTGSVFRQSSQVRHVFYNVLQESFPGLEVRRDLVEPVEGALVLARKAEQTKAG